MEALEKQWQLLLIVAEKAELHSAAVSVIKQNPRSSRREDL